MARRPSGGRCRVARHATNHSTRRQATSRAAPLHAASRDDPPPILVGGTPALVSTSAVRRQLIAATATTAVAAAAMELANGVYRLAAPMRLTADDSGSNGHTVVWRAAPSARPVVSGARAVTGRSVADQSRNIWRASVTRARLPAALRPRRGRHPGTHPGEPRRLHRLQHRDAALQRCPELPEQRDGVRQLVHRPVRAGAEHQREPHHDAAAGVEQQLLLRHLHQPAPGRSALSDQRLRVPRRTRRVVPQPRNGVLYYTPGPGRTWPP